MSLIRCRAFKRGGLLMGILIAWVPLTFAGKKLNKEDKRWLERQVAPLITGDERQIFKDLESDEEREVFKEIFWARRDPTPATRYNEFQEDYEARWRAAERNFKIPGRGGADTDMAKIFLLLGAPGQSGSGRTSEFGQPTDEIESQLEGSTTEQRILGGGGDDGELGTFDSAMTSETLIRTWVYEPNEALGIPDGLTVRFRAQPNFGYRLMRNKNLDRALERVRRLNITNPDVTYQRDVDGRLLSVTAGASKVESIPAGNILMDLRDNGVEFTDVPFETQPAFFRGRDGDIYVPMLFEIDGLSLAWNGDKADTTVYGMVEDERGYPLFQFEENARLSRGSSRYAYFEMPLQLGPGRYMLYLGVRDNGSSKLGTKIEELHVPAFDGQKLELSTVLLFAEGEKSDDPLADVGRAFVIGGYQFTPKPDAIYKKTERLSGVYNAYGYGVDDGESELTAQYVFLQDGIKKGQTQDEPFISASEEAAITVFDIPLSSLEPGNYTFRIQVTDHVRNEVVTHDIDFVVR